jgi:hypothetical protein
VIGKNTAAAQVQRMTGLDFFPREKAALQDLIYAVQVASTDEIAERIVTLWIETEKDAPKPAQIRVMMYAANEKRKEHLAKCPACGGSGFVTVWYLVTYRGQSFVREKSELLPDVTTSEQANIFAEKIARNPGDKEQTVLSAAKVCACRKAA